MHRIGKKQAPKLNKSRFELIYLDIDVVFFDSAILFGELDCGTFIRAWMGRGLSPKLCWRATRDGWLGGTFHAYCDYKKPTVTIVKVGRYVFGGYTTASWGGKINSDNYFIFILL